jgi:hypothetical protein
VGLAPACNMSTDFGTQDHYGSLCACFRYRPRDNGSAPSRL